MFDLSALAQLDAALDRIAQTPASRTSRPAPSAPAREKEAA